MARRSVVLALLMLALRGPAFAQQKDVITLKNHETRDGKVVRVTFKEVAYSPGGQAEMSELVADVEGIFFFDAPFALGRGEEELRRGNVEGALAQFRRALDDVDRGACRSLHKQYILYAMGRAHQQGGNLKEAVKAYRRLLAEVPDSMFAAQTVDRAKACAEQAQDWAAVDDLIDLMRKAPGGLRDFMRPLADDAEAWKLFRERKFAEARDRFERLAREPNPETQAKAKAGVIRCLASEKRTEDLRRFCETVVRGNDTEAVLVGAAWTALGDLAYAQSQEKDLAALKEALLYYLRARELYPPSAGGSPDDHVRALFHAARCFDKLRDAKSSPDDKNEYKKRALDLYEEVLREYRQSPWASKAEQEVAQLRR